MSDNTIVTIGDINYLWGLFLLIASARKARMDEPFLVGVKNFTPEAERILEQLGDVKLVSLDDATLSLTCYKPHVMLKAKTPFVTWADSDAFFTGNVSSMLKPDNPDEIHFRLRSPVEMPGAFRNHTYGENGRTIPRKILDVWRRDIEKIAGRANDASRYSTSGSGCFCALSLERYRNFLTIWDELQMTVLPKHDVGVADHALPYYHQLDESTLNACLNFVEDAPRVQDEFKLDKDLSRLYVHFIARPKPWVGWTSGAFRHFDSYVAVVEWAQREGLQLPGPVPFSLCRKNKTLARLMIPYVNAKVKVQNRLRKLFGSK